MEAIYLSQLSNLLDWIFYEGPHAFYNLQINDSSKKYAILIFCLKMNLYPLFKIFIKILDICNIISSMVL